MDTINFLAKPYGETIVQHTKNLLKEYQHLKKQYPNALNQDNWELLKIACQYHDLGKINLKFQQKMLDIQQGKKVYMMPGEIQHALLSITLLPIASLKQKFNANQIKSLCYAIALHHERDFSNITPRQYRQETCILQVPASHFDFQTLGLPVSVPKPVSARYFRLNHYLRIDDSAYHDFVLIKGLLNRIDFAASGHYEVESKQRIELAKNVLTTWQKKNKNTNWNELQKWTYQHRNDNIVVIGQTGLGKTESALRWLDNDQGFFLLPLRSAINSIYARLSNNYKLDKEHLALLHSDMMSVLLDEQKEFNLNQFKQNVNESKEFSKQLTVATLDQLFNFVYRYQGYESKLATLAYSKTVVDEIQMYSPILLAYTMYALREIQKYNGKFEIMTATLSPFIVDRLTDLHIKFIQPDKPFFNKKLMKRHSVKTIHEQLNADDILKQYHDNKVLVVCNTIKKAEQLYSQLKNKANVHLIHSRFIKQDRAKLEKEICAFAQTDNHESGIWIGTQVVEASLDIDFDILMTEMSELNSLFQRMGRCYRKRNFDKKGYNIFVYDEKPSGINKSKFSVIDYQLFRLSKQALQNVDGILDEQQKIDLINKTYTTDNIKKYNQQYLDVIDLTLNFLNSIANERVSKAEVNHHFRSINTIDVIPEQVFDNNQEEINHALDVLNEKIEFDNGTEKYKEKILARNTINQYLVSVPIWVSKHLINNSFAEKVGYHILSEKFKYDSGEGLILNKQ